MKSREYFLKLFCILFTLWVSIFTGIAFASSSAIEKILPLQLGDYLSVEYIDLLKKTRSPMKAGEKSDQRQYIKVTFNAKQNVISLTMMGSFHEGLGGLIIDTSLNIIRDDFGEAPVKLNVISSTEFSIAVDGKKILYRYVGNLKQFLAKCTVMGKYQDSAGALYIFTEDGLAKFPDRSFQYEIPADLIIGSDQIYEAKPYHDGFHYGFKLMNNELKLFNMGGPMGDKPEAIPFVTLTRIE